MAELDPGIQARESMPGVSGMKRIGLRRFRDRSTMRERPAMAGPRILAAANIDLPRRIMDGRVKPSHDV
jgi:hypothetical protein